MKVKRSNYRSRLTTSLFAAGIAATVAMPVRAQVNDPLETMNRAIFQFNDAVDRTVLRPVAEGDVKVVPSLVRRGVTNVFGNISDAFSAVNNLLQGKREPLGNDLGRVLVNSTFGLGGIFDIASEGGVEKYGEDFGQTLGYWGLGPGPYLVLPILGPSDVRDAVGLGVHGYFDPINRYVEPEGAMWGLHRHARRAARHRGPCLRRCARQVHVHPQRVPATAEEPGIRRQAAEGRGLIGFRSAARKPCGQRLRSRCRTLRPVVRSGLPAASGKGRNPCRLKSAGTASPF